MADPVDMITFAVVAREGSVSAASRVLRTSKQAISERMLRLEQAVGAALLTRHSRGVHLTPIGQNYAVRCQAVADLVELADLEAKNALTEPTGRLKIAAPINLGQGILPGVAASLAARYPGLELEILLTNELVVPGTDLDLVIRVGPIQQVSFKTRRVNQVRMVLVAAPSVVAKYTDWAQLPDAPAIVLRPGERWSLNGKSFSPRPRLIAGDLAVATKAAESGVGIARLPEIWCEPALQAGTLISLFPDQTSTILPVQLIFPEGRPSAKVAICSELIWEAMAPYRAKFTTSI